MKNERFKMLFDRESLIKANVRLSLRRGSSSDYGNLLEFQAQVGNGLRDLGRYFAGEGKAFFRVFLFCGSWHSTSDKSLKKSGLENKFAILFPVLLKGFSGQM